MGEGRFRAMGKGMPIEGREMAMGGSDLLAMQVAAEEPV